MKKGHGKRARVGHAHQPQLDPAQRQEQLLGAIARNLRADAAAFARVASRRIFRNPAGMTSEAVLKAVGPHADEFVALIAQARALAAGLSEPPPPVNVATDGAGTSGTGA